MNFFAKKKPPDTYASEDCYCLLEELHLRGVLYAVSEDHSSEFTMVTFRVRHETKNVPAFVVYAGNGKCRAVWIFHVRKGDMKIGFEFRESLRTSHQLPFAVCYWKSDTHS